MQTQLFALSASRSPFVSRLIAALAVSFVCTAASAGTLDRIKQTGHIKLGYFDDVRPFSYRTEAGGAEGYAVALCQQVAEGVKKNLNLPGLVIDWVQVPAKGDFLKLMDGSIDLMCSPAAETLARRADVSFSIPIFPAGVRAVLRKDAPTALRDVLAEKPGAPRAVWRGSPAQKSALSKKAFSVVIGTTTEAWLANRMATFEVEATVVEARNYREGLQQVLDGKADAFFGDRAVVLGAMNDAERANLVILDRMMTNEPVSLPLARGDDEFRLLVDRALSETYASAGFAAMYTKYCGKPDELTKAFFQWTALPQ